MSSTLIGQKAPEFTLPNSDGENFSLSELDGQWKVIFFYARDGSPTCKRGCLSFKEQHDLFQSLTPPVQIIGISQDSAKIMMSLRKSWTCLLHYYLMKTDWFLKHMVSHYSWVDFPQNRHLSSAQIVPFTIATIGYSGHENMSLKFSTH